MSWLIYGLNSENMLISIEHVPRGRTSLRCPYCGGGLTAKKGSKKAHHFAHTLETCRAVERGNEELPILPCYDRFNLNLSSKEFQELKRLWQRYGVKNAATGMPKYSSLIARDYIDWNSYRGRSGGYEFTQLGKIPVGALSLRLFNDVQQDLLIRKLAELEDIVNRLFQPTRLYCYVSMPQALMDLRLYRAQLKRVLAHHLYYLQLQADGETFYKIGVTRREVKERVLEVESDLRSHFQSVAIRVLGTWEHRGNVELYFKYRYSRFNRQIGSLTEFFQFLDPTDANAALWDLRRMKPKELTQQEKAILEDKPSDVEQAIEDAREAYRVYERGVLRSQAIQTGMQKAAQWGQHIGRPKGEESITAFLAKPKNQSIMAALKAGLSLRQTANRTGASINTIRKVKALMASDRL